MLTAERTWHVMIVCDGSTPLPLCSQRLVGLDMDSESTQLNVELGIEWRIIVHKEPRRPVIGKLRDAEHRRLVIVDFQGAEFPSLLITVIEQNDLSNWSRAHRISLE